MDLNPMSSLLMVWASCGSPGFKSMYPPGGVRRMLPLPGRNAKDCVSCTTGSFGNGMAHREPACLGAFDASFIRVSVFTIFNALV